MCRLITRACNWRRLNNWLQPRERNEPTEDLKNLQEFFVVSLCALFTVCYLIRSRWTDEVAAVDDDDDGHCCSALHVIMRMHDPAPM